MPTLPARDGFRLVVIAASAGGVTALSEILSQLSPTFPLALAIVQHRSLAAPHLLASVLQNRTRLTVQDAADGDECLPGHVYVAPPGIHLVVDAQRRLTLRDGIKVRHVRPSGDVLFASAAEAFGRELIALVLTGGDGDGADGVRIVKQHGGTVISQDEASAQVSGMPRSAIETGDVDYILSLADIAPTLEGLAVGGIPARTPPHESTRKKLAQG
jgi:two-component system chemotaxis response regulator CheB